MLWILNYPEDIEDITCPRVDMNLSLSGQHDMGYRVDHKKIKFISISNLTIIPRARMGYESIAHEAEGRMGY